MEKPQSKLQVWINSHDKFVHTWIGCIITIIAALLFHAIFQHKDTINACFFGIACGTIAGASKELIWDKLLKRGHCDFFDFLATFFGSVTGFVILLIYFNN